LSLHLFYIYIFETTALIWKRSSRCCGCVNAEVLVYILFFECSLLLFFFHNFFCEKKDSFKSTFLEKNVVDKPNFSTNAFFLFFFFVFFNKSAFEQFLFFSTNKKNIERKFFFGQTEGSICNWNSKLYKNNFVSGVL
jgi:hypothetical protein